MKLLRWVAVGALFSGLVAVQQIEPTEARFEIGSVRFSTNAPESCAQKVENTLSGTWELINENGTKKTASNTRFPIMTLIIVDEASEIRITRKRMKRGKEEVVNYLYYTDGRGETNVGRVWQRPEAPKLESVTNRDEDKITTEYKKIWLRGAAVNMFTAGGYAREYWRLGSDSKTLSLTARSWSVSGGSGGPGNSVSSLARSKLVFRRVS